MIDRRPPTSIGHLSQSLMLLQRAILRKKKHPLLRVMPKGIRSTRNHEITQNPKINRYPLAGNFCEGIFIRMFCTTPIHAVTRHVVSPKSIAIRWYVPCSSVSGYAEGEIGDNCCTCAFISSTNRCICSINRFCQCRLLLKVGTISISSCMFLICACNVPIVGIIS